MDELFARTGAGVLRGVLRRRRGSVRVTRSAWRRRGGWSPEEAAAELHSRRAELIGQLRRRCEARGVPVTAQEEIVDDAITAVVMSKRIENEQHLIGAFWLAVDHRARRWREGRHLTRLGSRQRVEFDGAVERVSAPGEPFEAVELADRMARAADFMAQLDARERRVVSVMAGYGVGPVPAARLLALPLGEVRAASRSASAKLEQVAAISAAGRMCDYRYSAITAHAAGQASAGEATAARAHLSACVSCRKVYGQLRREMRDREFQRRAVAAFLPAPAVVVGHGSWLDRLLVWAGQRPGGPRVPSERAVELLGGGGAIKAVAVGTAVVVAGAGAVHSVTASPAVRHRARRHVAASARTARIAPSVVAHTEMPVTSLGAAGGSRRSSVRRSASDPVRHVAAVPNRASGYLAVGQSASGASSQPRAGAASVTHASSPESDEPPPRPTHTGGGTSLGYLGG